MARPRRTTRTEITDFEKQAAEIMRLAEKNGTESNFFFQTTFKRYLTQITVLAELEKVIKESGTLVEKEYVKGRGNVYTHPAISEYNRTTDSANKTVATLIKIVQGFKNNSDDLNDDPLTAIINGDRK